jgi:anti-sigma factor RsiW
MSCSHAQRLIFAERDGSLDSTQRARLDEHLARCPTCGQMRAGLARTVESWRQSTANVTVPPVSPEWHSLRRKLREEKSRGWFRFPRPATLAWISLPTAAAAALAFAFYSPQVTAPPPSPLAVKANAKATGLARAVFVDVPGNSASTMVYVDNTSGWLVVWADSPGKG